MATFAYLLLDADNDPVFDPGAQLTNSAAVAQAILTNLRLWQGQWWEDLNLGLPVFQSMLGQLGSQRTQAAAALAVRQQIEATPYVTQVQNVVVGFQDGRLSFTATVTTAFTAEPVTISYPAQSAQL